MKLFSKDLDRDVVIVAEIGVNHEGSVDNAATMLRMAAEAGADAVKLQTYTPERFVTKSDAARYDRVSRFALSRDDHLKLCGQAKDLGIALFSTAVTEDVVHFLSEAGGVIKIASGDLTFRPVIDAALSSGSALILSTGNCSIEEIDQTLLWCRQAIGQDAVLDRVAILHCIASYPAPLDQLNLRSIPFLRDRYGLTTGYSNHAREPEAILAAVALGAQVVELHFTDRRDGRTFHDHALSFEQQELASLVLSVKKVRSALGDFSRPAVNAEAALRPLMRKGLVAARNLSAGTVIGAGDLHFARPATEFQWHDLKEVVGLKMLIALRKGELLTRKSVGLS